MIQPPCKGCPDRYSGCHGKCEKYLTYRAKKDEINEKLHQEKQFEVDRVGKFSDLKQKRYRRRGRE